MSFGQEPQVTENDPWKNMPDWVEEYYKGMIQNTVGSDDRADKLRMMYSGMSPEEMMFVQGYIPNAPDMGGGADGAAGGAGAPGPTATWEDYDYNQAFKDAAFGPDADNTSRFSLPNPGILSADMTGNPSGKIFQNFWRGKADKIAQDQASRQSHIHPDIRQTFSEKNTPTPPTQPPTHPDIANTGPAAPGGMNFAPGGGNSLFNSDDMLQKLVAAQANIQ